MLYYLFRYLNEFGIPGSHMWTYISFRALLTLILSLIISAWFGEYFIRWMKRHHVSEAQRDKSIDPYGVEKKGVPTMGGIIIIVSIIIPCLLFGRLRNIYMILMLVTTVWLGLLGFADDYIKMKVTKDGLRPIYKLIGQTVLGLFVGLTLWLSPDAVIRENVTMQKQGTAEVVVHKSEKVKSTMTTIPFVKNNNLDYAEIMSFCGKYKTAAGWVLFVVMTTLVVVAVSNGSNLNDGMDGMAAGNSAIIGVALGVLAYVSSHIEFASYLNIMFIPGSEELVIFICAFVGALIGFNKEIDKEVAKDVAMQAAAMAPVAIDKADCDPKLIEHERMIGREQARQEGKPEAILDKIAEGKVNKFLNENTLLNQALVKNNKITVGAYIKGADKDATVVAYKRFSLND